ncbi:MAG: insulinase family protein, partial [Planctomycetes bacterium]|nr:insulinase family protein [Planctomycetota bacterium]
DPEDVFRMADDALAGEPVDEAPPIRRIYPEEGPGIAAKEARRRMVVALPKLAIGFKDRGAGGGGRALLEQELATEFALDIIFGKGGDLYRDLYEEGLIDESFSWHTVVHPEVGYTMIGGDTPKPAELERRVFEAVRRAAGEVASPARFERARRKFLGAFLKRFNSLEFIANNFAFYRFLGTNLFDAVGLIADMDRDAIQARIREHLDPDAAAVALIEPGEPGPAASAGRGADPRDGS